jgi:hypothetical protein
MTRERSRIRRARTAALLIAIGLLTGGGPASARPAAAPRELSAEQIIDEMIAADPLGYGGAEARVVMALVNNRDQQQTRKVVMYSRKDGKTRRLFLRFLSPADIAGTAFLGIDDDGDRVQHLFMPAMAKTRRISSSQRNASFVGTDFSYADLDNRDIDDSSKRKLADEDLGGQSCWVIEVTPSDAQSQYGRVQLWIAKQTFLPLKIRFFGKGGDEIKRYTTQEVKKVQDRWLITESRMVDLKREHTTVFKVIEVTLRKDIDLEQFTVRALERG